MRVWCELLMNLPFICLLSHHNASFERTLSVTDEWAVRYNWVLCSRSLWRKRDEEKGKTKLSCSRALEPLPGPLFELPGNGLPSRSSGSVVVSELQALLVQCRTHRESKASSFYIWQRASVSNPFFSSTQKCQRSAGGRSEGRQHECFPSVLSLNVQNNLILE